MDLSFSSLSLATTFLACAYLTFKAFTPPNPAPPKNIRWKSDIFMRHQTPHRRALSTIFLLLSWSYHILLILNPPTTPSLLCPHPAHLDAHLFVWSPYTASFTILILIAAPIRMLAYHQLGQNFTFTLARPKTLVKTGLYRYVRHPSYPTLFACFIATGALLLRGGGVAGCWMPEWAARWKGLDGWGVGCLGLTTLFMLGIRVREEEEMLRSEFGEEYEEYARKTKRFLPGIV